MLRDSWKRFVRWLPFAKILGFLSLTIGLFGTIEGPIPYPPILGLSEFHRKISTELVGIGMAVLIIDAANERRAEQQLKAQLIREMGSNDSGIALRAVKELDAHGWLLDGSLRGADLTGANLQTARLDRIDLQKAHLDHVNFQGTWLAACRRDKDGLNWRGVG